MPQDRPNFLVILADDLGFSDIGCYGSEIKTPNIDALAAEANSLRFTSYHVAAACSPTRSMLMSGVEHHLTGFGQLAEMIKMSPAHQGAPGHEGYLNDKIVTLPELLSDAGYFTCMAGKWHLGLRRRFWPDKKGFQKSIAMLAGACNHYAWDPTYDEPQNSQGFFDSASASPHVEDGQHVRLPEDFYSSDFYATKLVGYLSNRSEDEAQKPFFAYLPFTAPHWPLQAPKESVEPYKGRYSAGPAALRLERLASLRDKGLIPADVVPHEVVAVQGEPPEWDQLAPHEQAKSARAMETYAGMVSRMDENIGKVVDHLKETGQYNNTYILFMSDNGAEGASYEARPMAGQSIVDHVNKYYDNSLENIGRPNSFVWYGTRWAQAATAPSRLYKMFATEGGCRVPLVLKPPKGDKQSKPAVTDAFCTVLDLVPTFLEEAGAQHPGSNYHGHAVHGLDPTARSIVKFLTAPGSRADKSSMDSSIYAIHPEDEPHGWEMGGSGGLRRGRFKITFVPKPKGPQKWELYDIVSDPGEVKDLRDMKPELFEELHDLWLQYKARVGVVGVTGEYDPQQKPPPGLTDEFEDDTRWVRSIGNEPLPARFSDEC